MTEKLNRYINRQRRAVAAASSSTSSTALNITAHWKPLKIPPQVILMRLQTVVNKTGEKRSEEEKNDSESSTMVEVDHPLLSKELRDKVEDLQCLLHHSPEQCLFLREKQSHCFWCTCPMQDGKEDEDSETKKSTLPSFFIPTKVQPEFKETTGYGHFCSPNCAIAWLYQENISPHDKHERDQLIHLLFLPEGSTERFRPAPDPRMVLAKYTGNLTPYEYRQLFQSELFLYPMQYNVTRQWKELPEMTDSKLTQFYGKNFQGFRNGFKHRFVAKSVN